MRALSVRLELVFLTVVNVYSNLSAQGVMVKATWGEGGASHDIVTSVQLTTKL